MDLSDLHPDPLTQVRAWWEEAREAAPGEWTEAAVLATSTPDGRPAARAVIVRSLDDRGFVFYTDTSSRKGAELRANPQAALVFLWEGVRRSVRVEGDVERVSEDEVDDYWARRPRGHRLSASVSLQSTVVESRAELEQRAAALAARYPDDIPRPDRWGGYRVLPRTVELWLARADRLHDRFRYRRTEDGWALERLAP